MGTALSLKKGNQMILPSLYSGVVASLKNWLLMWLSSFDKGCLLWATSAARVSRKWGPVCLPHSLLVPVEVDNSSYLSIAWFLQIVSYFSQRLPSHKDCRYNVSLELRMRLGLTVCRLPIGTRLSQAFPILAALSGKGWKCGGGERGREVTWVQGFVVVRMNN